MPRKRKTSSVKDDTGKTLYCSFCGKSQHEVKKLIAGPSNIFLIIYTITMKPKGVINNGKYLYSDASKPNCLSITSHKNAKKTQTTPTAIPPPQNKTLRFHILIDISLFDSQINRFLFISLTLLKYFMTNY